jgi:hypothetical protein
MQATVFYVISTLLTVIPPFLISYRSQGFWIPEWLLSINFCYVMQATVFYVISTLLTVIPPFLIAYRSQGFWINTGYLA